ncbi:MAG: hypothetical protein J6N32_09770 [Clostridia bacterium]|nr:hypothetical protein [Clostridia bacterium]
MKPTKLYEEIRLIAGLAFTIPTAVLLTTPALWWERLSCIEVFALWMLGIVVVGGACIGISLYDEAEKAKERAHHGRRA